MNHRSMSPYQNSSTVSWKLKTPRLHRVLEMQGSDSSNSWNSKTVFLFFLSAILKTSRVYPVACRPGDCARRAMAVHILSLPEQEPPSIAPSARSSLSGPPQNLDFVQGICGSNENDENQKPGRPSGMSIRKCRRVRNEKRIKQRRQLHANSEFSVQFEVVTHTVVTVTFTF